MPESWHFVPHRPDTTLRDPIAGAFFASDAVSEPGEALVREGIQNSLDAASDGGAVLVRISLVEDDAPSWEDIIPYVTVAMPHYHAEGNGLLPEYLPTKEGPHRLLVFEDFGTTGLLGDERAPYPSTDGTKNNFYHFFRAEGRTDKQPGERGSWGIGKYAFFRASQTNTVFGLTVSADDRKHLLMGKTILKSHVVGDALFQDGSFGIQDANPPHMVLPIESAESLSRFRAVFRMERQSEPGLSVVVPWPDPEITESTITQATFRNCFYAILSGSLSVMVDSATVQTILNSDNILEEARRWADPETGVPIIELAEWAINGDADAERHALAMPPVGHGWAWDAALFPGNLLRTLANKVRDQEPMALRVPVTIRKRDGNSVATSFDVYMKCDDSTRRLRPTFVRDGIVISDVAAPAMRGVRALIVVDDPPMSEFVGDSENPSHTVWQPQQVKHKYLSGVGNLRFVMRCVSAILTLVSSQDRKPDKRLLSEFFPVPKKPGVRPGGNGVTRRAQLSIGRISGGFSVTAGGSQVNSGDIIEITAAYDVRHGSAFTRYSERDFHFGQPPCAYTCEGANLVAVGGNRMVVETTGPRFRIAVQGFDENRDIRVRAVNRGVLDAHSTN